MRVLGGVVGIVAGMVLIGGGAFQRGQKIEVLGVVPVRSEGAEPQEAVEERSAVEIFEAVAAQSPLFERKPQARRDGGSAFTPAGGFTSNCATGGGAKVCSIGK